jgi:hypothetical protein
VVTCELSKAYLASESNFIEGLQANAQTCGVPAEIIKQAREGCGKASEIGKQVCEAAARPGAIPPILHLRFSRTRTGCTRIRPIFS